MPDLNSFHELVKKGDLNGVRAALVEEPALLDATNESGQSSFLLAKYYRQPEIAEYLLSLSPKLDVFAACVAGQVERVLAEIDGNLNLLECRNADGWTPLHLAAFFGHIQLAKGLLNRGAAVDVRSSNAMNNTPLHAAAAGNHPELVSLLLEQGANANALQHGGWTALHAAAQNGNLDMAQTLLVHGAAVAVRAENNQSPLDLALVHGKGELVELLESRGAQLQ